MLQHIMDKWDSYLSVLLGILLITAVKVANPKLLYYFKFFVFFMIGVVILDTILNFGQHESIMWKLAAIVSNAIVLASCIFILKALFRMLPAVSSPAIPLLSHPQFLTYLGVFLIVENLMWIFIYDHF